MRIGNLVVTAARWPWQKGYNWHGMADNSAPLNSGGARFGGGWKYQLGISIGGTTVILNLLYGMVRINWESKKDREAAERRSARLAQNMHDISKPSHRWFSAPWNYVNRNNEDEIPF